MATVPTIPATSTRPMLSPSLIKSFKTDFELAKNAYQTAQVYLQFEDHIQEAADGMRRTWMAAMECGAALKRIHDSGSWASNFAHWKDVYAALHISRRHCDRLMACSEILSSLPQDKIGQIGMPLSFRRMEMLGEATDKQREQVLDEVAANPDEADSVFSRLRQTLQSMAETNKSDKISDSSSPTAKRADKAAQGPEWAKKQLSALISWFKDHDDVPSATDLTCVLRRLELSEGN